MNQNRYTPIEQSAPRTIKVPEIMERLGVGEVAVYRMLKNRQIPAIRVGRNWIISRCAYERWESTIGEVGSDAMLQGL